MIFWISQIIFWISQVKFCDILNITSYTLNITSDILWYSKYHNWYSVIFRISQVIFWISQVIFCDMQNITSDTMSTTNDILDIISNIVRSPFCKHKYDIERNKMRKRIGWLWEMRRNKSARVSLMYSNNQHLSNERLHCIYWVGLGQHSLPPFLT